MNQAVIRLEDVSRHYQSGEFVVKAVDQVSLELNQGEFAVLSGPSGSGKTTLLNLIGGIDKPDQGEVKIDGELTNHKNEAELTKLRLKKIGFVFQSYNLLPVLSVFENIQLILQLQKVPAREHRDKIMELLGIMGLETMHDRFPSQLSGGQQQRVTVARALIGEPAIILADEPTGNLDSKSGHEIMGILNQLYEDGNTIILVTHEDDIAKYSNRIVRLLDGKIVSDEPVKK